jgi:hypothetical protein
MVRLEGQDLSKPWYDQPKNFARGYKLAPPYDNITVGCDPGDGMTKDTADSYDAIVNVSSTKCTTFEPSRPDQRTYWYPIIEMGRWSLGYLLWLKEVMDYHYNKGHKIYLHCHAGAFRSPSAACLWLESRGHTKEEALKINNDKTDGLYRIQERQGNIPKRKDQLFKMFRKQEKEIKERGYGTLCVESILTYSMNDVFDHETMSGKYRTQAILHKIFWFYYEPKYWIKEQIDVAKRWLKKEGYVGKKGNGSTHYTRKYFWSKMAFAEPNDKSTRQMSEWSFIPNVGWVEFKQWVKNGKGEYEYKYNFTKCDKCDGRGVTIDETKPFGQGHAHCETCERTGIHPKSIKLHKELTSLAKRWNK